MVSIAGIASGGTILLSPHKKTSIFYSLILLTPVSIALMLDIQKDHHQFLGVLGLLFCCAMATTAKIASDFTASTIRLKNQNLSLLNTMEEKVERRTQKIYELSNLDPLTNLLNRSAFLKKLDIELSTNMTDENYSLAVLFIDLNNFKHVNDSMGHKVGDLLLIEIANRILKTCTENNLVCRWGGDEFLIAFPDISESVATEKANSIINHISNPYTINNNIFSISATIGISMFPKHADKSHALIHLADSAMYYQKTVKTSHVEMFSTQLKTKLERENRLKDGLDHAIENNEFYLNYQPILCAKTKKIYACESLLRWTLDGELISPVEFIPLAEQYGHIIEIGTWVLEQACKQASLWPELHAIAVNVSVIQLQDQQFIAIVENALAISNLAPEKLHIEITESVFSNDKAVMLERIKALQNRGIKVSIDDFGTEYSSLSVIQNLNVNMIKIDRSFVSQLDANGFSIISAVLQIASSLGYKVVAEGVEEQYQAEKLKDMGVDYLQGFLFAKPMNAEKFKLYLEQAGKIITN